MWNKYDTKINPKWAWAEDRIGMTQEEQESYIQDVVRTAVGKGYTKAHSVEAAKASMKTILNGIIWVNGYYLVNISDVDTPEGIPDMLHLSIKNTKKSAVRDWRDFQQIKTDLVGPECEAAELFPAESRLIDGANQYHLWAIKEPGRKFPFGWNAGRSVTNEALPGTKQRAQASYEAEPLRTAVKVGRNDPCPCDSGKKYKKCCG
jgi:hypothetical protein